MGAIGSLAVSAIISVCLRPLIAVCHSFLSLALVVALSTLLVLWGGSLALSSCLSDPCVALVRHSGFIRSSASAVLWDEGGVTFSVDLIGSSQGWSVSGRFLN